eukprot:604824-Prymnesium_polylepis.1
MRNHAGTATHTRPCSSFIDLFKSRCRLSLERASRCADPPDACDTVTTRSTGPVGSSGHTIRPSRRRWRRRRRRRRGKFTDHNAESHRGPPILRQYAPEIRKWRPQEAFVRLIEAMYEKRCATSLPQSGACCVAVVGPPPPPPRAGAE